MNIPNSNSLIDMPLKDLANTNKKTVLSALNTITKMIDNNNQAFIESIKNNDLIAAKSCDIWG